MLKITVIILASIISTVILQDVNYLKKEPQVLRNQPQNLDELCARQSPPVEKQDVPVKTLNINTRVPAYISNPPQSLTQENVLYEPKIYEPKDPELKIYKPKPEKHDEPEYYNNRRKIYPNPTIIQPTSDEIVEKRLRQTTEKMTTKDCFATEKQNTDVIDSRSPGLSKTKDLQRLDTRRSFGDDRGRNEYQNDMAYAADRSDPNSDESVRNEMEDPISRAGVSMVNDNNRLLLMKNPRVCYACSSATNPTCWEPNRRTTIKYCNKEHASCITKIFGEGPTKTLIRDCAASCNDSPIPGLEPKYKSCKVCHSDLCNSAFSIKSYKLLYVLLLFTALKFTF